ncbi:hypothetical protein M501DRAFT_1004716 [Patellaria atrata CBS 101060]|uniref:Uncharacterized protein n=1 Tax=Patellaria atrata CBS 101060 TaxID=1346257 RepID=A0A9P4SA75_9PEZI|nr:hypothetical protein M501DRAFT_1004716 [Patellaria atrata CBS 101060]
MPHYLHPRSRSTISLFTGTLMASFLVVGLPHILPCPVDSRAFADGEMPGVDNNRQRKRRRNCANDEGDAEDLSNLSVQSKITTMSDSSCSDSDPGGVDIGNRARECPVPKPGGLVGQLLGFKNESRDPPSVVKVEPLRARRIEKNE